LYFELTFSMKTIRILILEDDLKALSVLMGKLFDLEEELYANTDPNDIAVTVFSEYTQVRDYLNSINNNFDVILLDRDCKAGGSFHVLDLEKYDPKKIISISTYPEYNEKAKKRGVTRVVRKDYDNLDKWGEELIDTIKELL
jgi:hypothetical protein